MHDKYLHVRLFIGGNSTRTHANMFMICIVCLYYPKYIYICNVDVSRAASCRNMSRPRKSVVTIPQHPHGGRICGGDVMPSLRRIRVWMSNDSEMGDGERGSSRGDYRASSVLRCHLRHVDKLANAIHIECERAHLSNHLSIDRRSSI